MEECGYEIAYPTPHLLVSPERTSRRHAGRVKLAVDVYRPDQGEGPGRDPCLFSFQKERSFESRSLLLLSSRIRARPAPRGEWFTRQIRIPRRKGGGGRLRSIEWIATTLVHRQGRHDGRVRIRGHAVAYGALNPPHSRP